jgi:replicative DNA helicase
MQIFDTNIETQVVFTICDSQNRNLVLSKINEDYFGSDSAKEIYRRIHVLLQAGKAVPSSQVLKNDQALSDPARALLTNPNAVALQSPDDIEMSLGALNKYRKARILLQTVNHAIESLKEKDPDVDAVVSVMENSLANCHSGSSKPEMIHITEANLDRLVSDLQRELDTPLEDMIPTGFREFDKKTGGFRKKNVITLASVSGGGKSAMMSQMAVNQYRMGFNVCIVSYEMDEIEIKYRMLTNISAIDHTSINLKRLNSQAKATILKKWEEFIRGMGIKNRLTIWCPTRELNIPEIAIELKPMGYDIVYIDYISLLKSDPKKQNWETLGDHARSAKLVANNLGAAIVLLAQYDGKEEKIRYSQAIVNNSNFVWAWDVNDQVRESGIIEVKQLKARAAEVYSFLLQRDMKYMIFRDFLGPPPPTSAPANTNIPKMPELA